jgi:large subunit ribosomal protein L1
VKDKILKAIKELKERSKKRNFSQTYDMVVSLKEIDMKKPESKIAEEFSLPKGHGEESRVVVFADNIKPAGAEIFTSEQIGGIARTKREAKKMIRSVDFFLAEPKLMPLVAKSLGQMMGPRGKLPKPVVGDVASTIKSLKNSIRVKLKDVPVMQFKVGSEKMSDDDVAENIEALVKYLEHRLPKGKTNIGKVMLKTSMSQPVRVEIYGEGRKA